VSDRPVVVKFGGELLDDPARLRGVVAALAKVSHEAATRVPLVVVHGGGKEIDAALKAAGIEKRQVEGLRITDRPTLDVVVAVLAGAINTRFVAALNAATVPAVGLTGADAGCAMCDVAPPHQTADGRSVDLGLVGIPNDRSDMTILTTLVGARFTPVVACIGIGSDAQLLNVNADTLAGHLAGRLRASRLVIAGTTAGVLDERGGTLETLAPAAIAQLISSGTASAGMVAKLRACEQAIAKGAAEVVIVDGTDPASLEAAIRGERVSRGTVIGVGSHFQFAQQGGN
jgi:acetylglutamate kinase